MDGHLDRHPTKQISHELINSLSHKGKTFSPLLRFLAGLIKCERVFEFVFKLIVDFRDDFCQWQLHKIVIDYTNNIYICVNNYDPCQEERGSKEP
jgi:hypothetical protein